MRPWCNCPANVGGNADKAPRAEQAVPSAVVHESVAASRDSLFRCTPSSHARGQHLRLALAPQANRHGLKWLACNRCVPLQPLVLHAGELLESRVPSCSSPHINLRCSSRSAGNPACLYRKELCGTQLKQQQQHYRVVVPALLRLFYFGVTYKI